MSLRNRVIAVHRTVLLAVHASLAVLPGGQRRGIDWSDRINGDIRPRWPIGAHGPDGHDRSHRADRPDGQVRHQRILAAVPVGRMAGFLRGSARGNPPGLDPAGSNLVRAR